VTDTAVPPVARGRERTRARLLDAAAEVFAEVGVDAASVEAICERAGFTRGAFYSNFDSKEELMLALTERVAEHKIELVAARVQQLRDTGRQFTPAEIVQGLLDVAIDERMDILLTSEIRTRAMRDARLAETYLAWQSGMVDRVTAVITEIGEAYGLRPRLPEREFAQLILQQWEDTSAYAVMAGLDFAALCTLVNDRTARLATALIDPA
jgi:AcrR family transcriptional regulator